MPAGVSEDHIDVVLRDEVLAALGARLHSGRVFSRPPHVARATSLTTREAEDMLGRLAAAGLAREARERGAYRLTAQGRERASECTAAKVASSDLVADLAAVASDLGRAPTAVEYNDRGEHAAPTLQRRFGGWNAALRAVGLEPRWESRVSDDALLTDIQGVADRLGHTPRVSDYDRLGDYGSSTVQYRFGGWNAALRAAGLEPRRECNISKRAIVSDLAAVARDLGRAPTAVEYKDLGRYSIQPAVDRFGGWNAALRAAGLEVRGRPVEAETVERSLTRGQMEVAIEGATVGIAEASAQRLPGGGGVVRLALVSDGPFVTDEHVITSPVGGDDGETVVTAIEAWREATDLSSLTAEQVGALNERREALSEQFGLALASEREEPRSAATEAD